MLEHIWLRKTDESNECCIFVHGRAGNYSVMSAFSSLIPSRLSIVSIQAPFPDTPPTSAQKTAFSWWNDMFRDQPSEEQKKQIESSFDKIEKFIDSLELKPRIAVGFSQGAAMLSLYIQRKPQTLKACALLAGFVLKNEEPEYYEKKPGSGPECKIFMTHGTNDQIIDINWAKEGYSLLKNKGFNLTFLETDAAHKVAASAMTELKKWLSIM